MRNPSARRSQLQADKLLVVSVSVFAFLLLALPVAVLMLRGVSSRAWEGLPNSSTILAATLLSFVSTFAVVCLAAALGTPLAYALSRYKFRGKRFVSLFIELPIVMPPAVAGLALLLTFGRNGVIGSLLADSGIIIPFSILAVIIAQFFISAPFTSVQLKSASPASPTKSKTPPASTALTAGSCSGISPCRSPGAR